MATPNRYYSSTAVEATLVAPMSNADLTLTVNDLTGWPINYPYTAVVDQGTATEEILNITGVSGVIMTCARAQDGSSAVDHDPGATVTHDVSARDFAEPQLHLASTDNVHGITGNVVGDTDVQTLTEKTLTAPILASPTITGTTTVPGGSGPVTVTWPNTGGQLVSATGTGTLSNKTLTDPIVNGGVLDATSTIDGITGTEIAADHATTAANASGLAAAEATLAKIAAPLSGSGTSSVSTANSTLFSTAALGVGTWLVTVVVSIATNNGTASLKVTAPSGTTVSGRTTGSYSDGASASVTMDGVLTFIATVASGTGILAIGSGSAMTGGSVLGNGVEYGYTAVQVA